MNIDDKLFYINTMLRQGDFHITGFLLTKDYIFLKAYKVRNSYYFIIPRNASKLSLDSVDKLMRYNTINDNKTPLSFLNL